MKEQEVYEIIRGIISKRMGTDPSKILPQSNLVEDIGADSLELVDLMMDLEETTGVRIENAELSDVDTVHDIVVLICGKLKVTA
jgi:acyl carrier protein